jgi:hypothetical protein
VFGGGGMGIPERRGLGQGGISSLEIFIFD